MAWSCWVAYARILRSQVLVLHAREFVDAIHALATLELAPAIVLEATLSFLGLGVQPPTPSWGGMIHEGREYLDTAAGYP